MEEILISGDISRDFNRLGITIRQKYNGTIYGVCEVTEEEFKKLCSDVEAEETWIKCGWRYCEGSNQGEPNVILKVNNKELKCWYDPLEDEDDEPYIPEYKDLLTYLCEGMGCSQFRNVCALTKDLAKYNNMKLDELFKKYQG